MKEEKRREETQQINWQNKKELKDNKDKIKISYWK